MGKARAPSNPDRPPLASVAAAIKADDIEALLRVLTPRQKRFAEEYVIDFNGTAATIRAGYSPKHAEKQAHLLVRHPGISYYIDHLSRSKENKIVSVNPDYIIQEVVGIIKKEGARDGDRLRGLELLARHLGMFIDRQEITGKDGGPLELEQRRAVEEEAQNFNHLLKSLRDRALREAEEANEKKTVFLD